jgi:hypothetical protein
MTNRLDGDQGKDGEVDDDKGGLSRPQRQEHHAWSAVMEEW